MPSTICTISPVSPLNRLLREIVPTAKARIASQSAGAKGVQDIEPAAATERIKVALIEDDDSVRQALSFQIRTAGFEVAAYSSAEQLLEASAANQFDCV